ncbi:serine/threonine-protein kinase PLK1-like isoform X2 [Lytechinus pictus]|uniref:serine/threonine-protein kinase PLK1-like isoform X2 n=2 Tax=Lytechinus pictus TaxID=7653 RepID=UPI0030B9F40D
MPLTRSPVLPVGLTKDVSRYAMDQLQKPAPLSPEDTPKTTPSSPSLSSKPHGAGREGDVKPPIPPARAPKATPAVAKLPELPAVIVDPETGDRYRRGRLLGKGGFARCYELTHQDTHYVYAGKIVPKERISKPSQREKMEREIAVHAQLRHPNIVGFHKHFQDSENIYIVLELCRHKSLLHMLKLRKHLTEPEVRYFMLQIIEGVRYLHSHCVIHRDLKLGNMFLTDTMGVKIGDFGLAAKLEFEGDRKRTMCGTPNYIAPEVLGKIGHSFEADVWALGCIMYTMLVGRPPFETSSLKETYARIKHNKYHFPETLSPVAKEIISDLLSSDPEERPPLEVVIDHEFFTQGFVPETLSPTACVTAPDFPITKVLISDRKGELVTNEFCRLKRESTLQRRDVTAPLSDIINNESSQPVSGSNTQNSSKPTNQAKLRTRIAGTRPMTPVTTAIKTAMVNVIEKRSATVTMVKSASTCSMDKVYEMLNTCLEHMPKEDHRTTPKYKPNPSEVVWVIKWVDYSNKYGFGYQLSNKVVGVMFNDKSRISFTPDRSSVQYLSTDSKVHSFPLSSVPSRLSKKVTLLDYFATYMDEHLIKGIDSDKKDGIRSPSPKRKGVDKPGPINSAQPYLEKWNRTGKAITMYLSNGTLQVNFFEDHTKVILSHNNNDHLVTYINESRTPTTYRVLHITHHGCTKALHTRLTYARHVLYGMMDKGEEENTKL